MKNLRNYIGGSLVAPVNGGYGDGINPATGQKYYQFPASDEEDLKLAVAAAEKAKDEWAKTSLQERSAYLEKIAAGIEKRMEEFVLAESEDNGKPVILARMVDIPRAVSNFRFFSQAITQFASESHYTPNVGINYTLRQPIGVVGCISPWNLPIYLFSWKIAPALATGNCVIAKPSEVTPYTAYLLSEVCQEIGLPDGVLNIVHGYGSNIGAKMVSHPQIKAISFTGGTQTGEAIARTAAPMFKKLSLELGGKNPNIIFADCDYDKMLATTVRSSFANQGQICLCGSRILVQRSIYERFKDDFVAKVASMKAGNPIDPKTKFGALVSEQHMKKVLQAIETAKSEGGKVLCGGNRIHLEGPNENGFFIAPTVIEGLDQNCQTNQEEIFGPVVTIAPFDSREEAIAAANSVKYGLAATVWTQNITSALSVADELHSGIVWINCWLERDLRTPFGGMKSSGVGREGGFEALRFFTEPKNVCIKYL